MNLKCKIITSTIGTSLLLSTITFADNNFPNGIYVKLGGTFGHMGIKGIDGKTSAVNNAALTKKNTTANKAGGMVALGYAFKTYPVRLELSYERRAPIDYNSNPVFSGGALTSYDLKSDVTNQSGMLTGIIDIPLSEYFIPYIAASAGLADNIINLKATTSGTTYKEKDNQYSFGWKIGIGAHIKIINNVLFDIGFQHVEFGKVTFGPWGDDKAELDSNDFTTNEGIVAITVFFGDQDPSHQPPTLMDD